MKFIKYTSLNEIIESGSIRVGVVDHKASKSITSTSGQQGRVGVGQQLDILPSADAVSIRFAIRAVQSDLCRHAGYKLEDAMAHVKHHRPVVAPNYNAMKEAIRNGLDN